jgi:hypothetical protein
MNDESEILDRSGRCLVEVLSFISLERVREPMKILVRMADVPAEIRTENFPIRVKSVMATPTRSAKIS